jgi:excisionase family DNA binding protein
MIDGEIMDVAETAAFLRVGKNAVYDLVARNEIPHKRVGRSIRFARSALLAWLGAPAHAMVRSCSSQVVNEES